MSPGSPQQYAAKWRRSTLNESAAYFDHFNELCELVGHSKPSDADLGNESFGFQRYVATEEGRRGFADAWLRGRFGIEYKSKGEDLDAAYRQLLNYRDNLYNPPLLIVSDFEKFEIHTNFNDTVSEVYSLNLDHIAEPSLRVERLTANGRTQRTQWSGLEVLQFCFFEPDRLRPGQTTEDLTEEAAVRFEQIAKELQSWMPNEDRAIARFLSRLIFCMFASDIGALPRGIVTQIAEQTPAMPQDAFSNALADLFRAMSTGGTSGFHQIHHFDGGLFEGEFEPVHTDGMIRGEILRADQLDWAQIEPAVFGTLFERIFNPDRRAQFGRHYTSREDIELLVEPVVMQPLRREWGELKSSLTSDTVGVEERLQAFLDRLAQVKVLDPACGSGNFLYVSLAMLKELEREVRAFGAELDVFEIDPRVHPRQLYGIEIDPYAHELASIVAWIGHLQWKHQNGIPFETENPILEPLENIELKNAVMEDPKGRGPVEPEWPTVDCIVGNPPFLGGKRLRTELGDRYVDRLFNLWEGRVRRESDLCCYWFEKARAQIESGNAIRAGLLGTQAIRGGANRNALNRIKESGDIFFAESDREWVLEGAAVQISVVAFDNGTEQERILDGEAVQQINTNLTGTVVDVTKAKRLKENLNICFMGDTKGGPFDIDSATAERMLEQPNPHGRPNTDVLVPWINGEDITRQPRNMWIIDFGVGMSEEDAAKYEVPFEYVKKHVKPARAQNKRAVYRDRWWLHVEPRSGMRAALAPLARFAVTVSVSKHRLFRWVEPGVLPDHALLVFARGDDLFFGILHSRAHEVWALGTGTQLREKTSGFRYTPTTTFETFPFPDPTDTQKTTIADAARELNELRENWLNPPEDSVGPSDLKRRTLTNLYNRRPTWLDNAHRKLDKAVFAAYGWAEEPHELPDVEILRRLLEMNLEREAV